MKIIRTEVIKGIQTKILKDPPHTIIIKKTLFFEYREKDLLRCLNYIQRRMIPTLKNKFNRESWERTKMTCQLLSQDKEVNEVAETLGLAPSTIERYLSSIDYLIEKLNSKKKSLKKYMID